MAWPPTDRRARLPPNWERLRARVIRRAGGQCEASTNGRRCPTPGTDVDHITRGDDHDLDNLQLLCRDHHNVKTSAEAQQARREQRQTSQRPQEQHPARRRPPARGSRPPSPPY